MKNFQKYTRLIIVLQFMYLTSCKTIDPQIDPWKSDDLSFLFSGKYWDAKLSLYNDYNGNFKSTRAYYTETVDKMNFATISDKNATNHGYYIIDGKRLNFGPESKDVHKFFTKEKLVVEFVGDTLGFENMPPTSMNVPEPFNIISINRNRIFEGENIHLTWNPSSRNEKVVLKITCKDIILSDSLRSLSYNKIIEDVGEFTIPKEAIENLKGKGRYEITIYRGSNIVFEKRKLNNVVMISKAYIGFTKEYGIR